MFTILDYSNALEYSIIRRYTNIVYYYYKSGLIAEGGRFRDKPGGHHGLGDANSRFLGLVSVGTALSLDQTALRPSVIKGICQMTLYT